MLLLLLLTMMMMPFKVKGPLAVVKSIGTVLTRFFTMSASGGAQIKLELWEDDVRNAFTLFVSKKELYVNHCQTKAGNDYYSDMVDTLCGWTTASPSNVKLCVSSREYPIFMTRFSPLQRLRLHMLTKYGIEAYVRD